MYRWCRSIVENYVCSPEVFYAKSIKAHSQEFVNYQRRLYISEVKTMAAILMNYKIPGYYIFFICLAVISCFSNPGMVVLAGCRVDNIDQAE